MERIRMVALGWTKVAVVLATLASATSAQADETSSATSVAPTVVQIDNSGLEDVERLSDHALDATFCEEQPLVSDVVKDLGHALQLELTEMTSPSVSDTEERELGEIVITALRWGGALKRDPATEAYLNDLLAEIVVHAERELDYHVYLFADPNPNAFALPGGIILVSSGLMDVVENEAQLVNVLAHEMGHHELRHVIGHVQYLKMLGLWDAESAATSASSTAATTVTTLQLPLQSRLEEAADLYGIEIATRLGYSPHQAAQLMLVFDLADPRTTLEDGGESFASFFIAETNNLLETHPRGRARACRIKGLIRTRYDDGSDPVFYVGKRNLQEFTPRHERAW